MEGRNQCFENKISFKSIHTRTRSAALHSLAYAVVLLVAAPSILQTAKTNEKS